MFPLCAYQCHRCLSQCALSTGHVDMPDFFMVHIPFMDYKNRHNPSILVQEKEFIFDQKYMLTAAIPMLPLHFLSIVLMIIWRKTGVPKISEYMPKHCTQSKIYLSGDEMFLEKMINGSNILGPLSDCGWKIYSAWDKEHKSKVESDGMRMSIEPQFDRGLPKSLAPQVDFVIGYF